MSTFNLFKNITPVTDTDEQLRLHILWLLFIRVLLYTLLLGITFLLHSKEQLLILPPPFIIIVYIFFIYSYSIGSALLLQKKNLRLKRFGLIQILSDTILISLLVYATGCSQSIFTAVFILPIITGGLILYRIGGLIPAAATTILYGAILTSEYLQVIPAYFFEFRYIPVDDYLVSMNVFAVYGLTFFLIAMLSGVLARRLRTTEDALTLTELKFDRLLLLYKQIFDDIMTGIITVDDHDRITSFNPAAEAITGYSEKDVTGLLLQQFFPNISTEKRERHTADLNKKDGTQIRIGYSCSELHTEDNPAVNETTWVSSKLITLQDISRIEEMEQQVRKAEKMAAIGELSASIAHDFRNPLAAISGSAQILSIDQEENKETDKSTHHSLTRIILRESERMANTITDFLHYARPATPEPQWFNLLRLAREIVERLPGENDHGGCVIQLAIPDDLDICADRSLLQLALIHLLKNSCYAARNSPEPVVLYGAEEKQNEEGEEYIVIEVRDKGMGLDQSIRDKVFDPFFSTREDAAGLGLAIVKQIVASHFGTVSIEGNQDQGSTVRIRLPLPAATP